MKKLLCVLLALIVTASTFAGIPVQAATVVAKGIDVSYWQGGNINWSAVASHDHGDFAILRAYCYGKDSYFDINYDRAKQAGVPIGAYCYIYGTTTAAVQAEVNALLSVIQGKQFEYPIYIDVEDAPSYSGLGRQTVTDLVNTACQMLEKAGYFAGVYTYTNFANNYIYMNQLTAYTTWIAEYNSTCNYTGDYAMWQYGCEGSVGGISPVDVNYSYMDFPTIIKNVGLNGYEPSVRYPYDVDEYTKMLYDGESKSNITTAFSTTASVYGSDKTQGDNSLKISCDNPAANAATSKLGGMAVLKLTDKADLSDYDYIEFDLYTGRTMTGSNGFQINFVSDTTEDGYNYLKPINDFEIGWHTISVLKKDISKAVSSADWSNINKLRFAWWNYAEISESTYFLVDNVRAMKFIPEEIVFPYVLDENTLMVNDGESAAGIVGEYDTTVSLDSSQKTQGVSGLKMDFAQSTGNDNIGGMAVQTLKEETNVKGYTYFETDVYFSRDMSGSHTLQLSFSANGEKNGYNFALPIENCAKGWHTFRMNLSDAVVGQATNANWRKIDTVCYTWYNMTSQTDATYFVFDNARFVKETVAPPESSTPSSQPESLPESRPEPEKLPYGDIDEDGLINASDALRVLRFAVAKQLFNERQLLIGELNGDDQIDAKDALLILRYAVELIQEFPIENMQ